MNVKSKDESFVQRMGPCQRSNYRFGACFFDVLNKSYWWSEGFAILLVFTLKSLTEPNWLKILFLHHTQTHTQITYSVLINAEPEVTTLHTIRQSSIRSQISVCSRDHQHRCTNRLILHNITMIYTSVERRAVVVYVNQYQGYVNFGGHGRGAHIVRTNSKIEKSWQLPIEWEISLGNKTTDCVNFYISCSISYDAKSYISIYVRVRVVCSNWKDTCVFRRFLAVILYVKRLRKFREVSAVETHPYHAIRKNYATNCAIQGVRLIWKQKIWLATYEFLWSLTNQNAWFVSSFCTELTLFCTVFEKNCTALNQSKWRNFFMYIITALIVYNSRLFNIYSIKYEVSIYLSICLQEITFELLDAWNAAEFSWIPSFYLISDTSQK